MADTWWFDETKRFDRFMAKDSLVDDYQQEGQNKGKCLLHQKLSHPLLLFQMAYFSSSSLRSFLSFSSGLQIKY